MVQSGLNISNWVDLLKDYNDNELCHFLAYGWPIGFYSKTIPDTVPHNHPSVIHQLEAINTLVAYRTLAHKDISTPVWALILPDNMFSSQALMSGRTKDKVLVACAREFWVEAAN